MPPTRVELDLPADSRWSWALRSTIASAARFLDVETLDDVAMASSTAFGELVTTPGVHRVGVIFESSDAWCAATFVGSGPHLDTGPDWPSPLSRSILTGLSTETRFDSGPTGVSLSVTFR